MSNFLAPLIAPALFDLHQSGNWSLENITEPESLPGWQQATLVRHHPDVGPGSSILIVTVLPNGVTQVLDPYMLTCGIYTAFEAAMRYLKDEAPLNGFGLAIDFPESP